MNIFRSVREFMYDKGTVKSLKFMIIVWSLIIIMLALLIDNPWILAGVLAYEVLP